jgi:hypothetical protein
MQAAITERRFGAEYLGLDNAMTAPSRLPNSMASRFPNAGVTAFVCQSVYSNILSSHCALSPPYAAIKRFLQLRRKAIIRK